MEPGEDAAVGFKQRAGEELAKARQDLQPLRRAGGVGHLHGGHLLGEIGGLDVQNAHADVTAPFSSFSRSVI